MIVVVKFKITQKNIMKLLYYLFRISQTDEIFRVFSKMFKSIKARTDFDWIDALKCKVYL